MNIEELHPTAAALFDDDGPAAYHARRYAPLGFSQTPNKRRRRKDGQNDRQSRHRRWREARPEQYARKRANDRLRERRPAFCVDCGAAIGNRTRRNRCRPCATRLRYAGGRARRTRQELTAHYAGGRSPHHERNVSRLVQLRLELPL